MPCHMIRYESGVGSIAQVVLQHNTEHNKFMMFSRLHSPPWPKRLNFYDAEFENYVCIFPASGDPSLLISSPLRPIKQHWKKEQNIYSPFAWKASIVFRNHEKIVQFLLSRFATASGSLERARWIWILCETLLILHFSFIYSNAFSSSTLSSRVGTVKRQYQLGSLNSLRRIRTGIFAEEKDRSESAQTARTSFTFASIHWFKRNATGLRMNTILNSFLCENI